MCVCVCGYIRGGRDDGAQVSRVLTLFLWLLVYRKEGINVSQKLQEA